jgi:hypothetical protein
MFRAGSVRLRAGCLGGPAVAARGTLEEQGARRALDGRHGFPARRAHQPERVGTAARRHGRDRSARRRASPGRRSRHAATPGRDAPRRSSLRRTSRTSDRAAVSCFLEPVTHGSILPAHANGTSIDERRRQVVVDGAALAGLSPAHVQLQPKTSSTVPTLICFPRSSSGRSTLLIGAYSGLL